MGKLQYNIHLLLNSKYRIFINLILILLFYSILYGNKIIFCMNDNIFELEKMRVHEKIIAMTTQEPDDILNTLEKALNLKAQSFSAHPY